MKSILLMLGAVAAASAAYPHLETSFRATGSIEVTISGANRLITFDENYEFGVERSAVTLIEGGINSTLVADLRHKQAFIYTGHDGCEEYNWDDKAFQVDIKIAKTDKNGVNVLPIHQLLTLNTSYLVSELPQVVIFQNVQVNQWTFKIDEPTAKLDIIALWSLPESGSNLQTPLRFQVKRVVNGVSVEQTINVNLFTHGEFNRQVFRPRRGVFCAGRKGLTQFPTRILEKLKRIRTKVEHVVDSYRKFGIVDTWFDPEEKLYKVNYSPIREEVQKGIQRIVSHVQGVVYEMRETRKCVVKQVKEIKEDFDPQTIFNPFDKEQFNTESLFGGDYISAGESVERNIPCNLYQRLRTDWPPGQDGQIESLWEWCLANDHTIQDVKLQVDGLPLISLRIFIKKSPYKISESYFYEGLQLAYNFHEAVDKSKEYLDNLAYDIKECFDDKNQKRLEFIAKIKDKATKALLERNTRHKEHVAAWTDAIIRASKLNISSLRVSTVQTRISEKGLEVNFVLLGRHPDLPLEVKEIPLDDAMINVKTALDNNQLSVDVELSTADAKTEKVNLKGEPGTLKSKVIEDEDEAKTPSGVSAGTMAAVAVVMLALGVAVGAAVIFQRKRRFYQRV